jgi:hypothetical protein
MKVFKMDLSKRLIIKLIHLLNGDIDILIMIQIITLVNLVMLQGDGDLACGYLLI